MNALVQEHRGLVVTVVRKQSAYADLVGAWFKDSEGNILAVAEMAG